MAATRLAPRDIRFYWILALLFWVALAFAVMPGGLDWASHAASVNAKQGSIIRRLQWLPLFALAAYVIWIRRDVALGMVGFINPFLLGFTFWVLASLLWSGYPGVTLRRLVVLVGIGAIALALQVASWQPRRLLRLLRIGVTLLLAASLPMVLVFPHLALQGTLHGDWIGVTRSKNHLGLLAGLGVLLWLHAWLVRDAGLLKALVWMVYSFALLIASHSASGLIATVALLPLVWLLLRPPVNQRHGWPIAILGLFVVIGLLIYAQLMLWGLPNWTEIATPVAHSVGRNVTLTGRLQIWTLISQEIAKHPWVGCGYGAFWLGANGPAPWITSNLYGIIWEAHNGYLDVLNETGVVGLILAVGFMLLDLRRALALLAVDRAVAVFHLLFLIFFMLSNVTESSLFRAGNFLFFISITTSLGLSRVLADNALRGERATAALGHRSAQL